MEDISIEQRKSFLNREKGLELQAIYKILSFSPDYVTTKLSSRISYFLHFNQRILKFAFALSQERMIILSCLTFGIFCICFQEIMILSWCLWSVLVLIISNKNIQKLKLTKNLTDLNLKISQVKELQFCCSAGICKNK